MYNQSDQMFIASLEEQKKLFLGWRSLLDNKITRKSEKEKRVFSLGSMKLLDYGGEKYEEIILIIPSLINRYYILDLSEKDSLIKYLLSLNYRVFVIEWDNPEFSEYQFNLEDYVLERIIPSINFISFLYKSSIMLLGYCLGGTLAIMVSLIIKDKIRGMILIATPWKFDEMSYLKYSVTSYSYPLIFPTQVKNLFYFMDYERINKKFSQFLNLQQDSEEYYTFLRVESWLDNGIAITNKIMIDMINLSQKRQVKFQGHHLGGSLRDENDLIPKLIIIPLKDRIVPIRASLPIIRAKNSTNILLHGGHIGILINQSVRNQLFKAIKLWKNLSI